MYYSVSVVVDGALEQDEICDTWEEVEDLLATVSQQCAEDGAPTEVFVLQHDHEFDIEDECACVQYLTDHAPYRRYNSESERPKTKPA